MRAVKIILATALLFIAARAFAVVTYDGATGVVNIPSVKVGNELYTNVTLQHLGNYRFRLTGASGPTALTPSFDATYDVATGILSIPTVLVGSTTYIDVILRNEGSFVFQLTGATERPPVGSGSASECFDPRYLAAGTKSVLNYRLVENGAVTQTSKTESEIVGPTTFNGRSAIEEKAKVEILTGTGAGTKDESRNFLAVQGLDLLALGSVTQATDSGVTLTQTTVLDPPAVFRFSLSAGQSVTTNYVATTTTTGLPFGVPPSTSSQSVTYTFLGFEDVSVPAGSFGAACKWLISTTVDGQTVSTTQWITRKGVPLKSVEGTSVTELTSGTVNGGPVGP